MRAASDIPMDEFQMGLSVTADPPRKPVRVFGFERVGDVRDEVDFSIRGEGLVDDDWILWEQVWTKTKRTRGRTWYGAIGDRNELAPRSRVTVR